MPEGIHDWAIVLHGDTETMRWARDVAERSTDFAVDDLAGETVLRHPRLRGTAQQAADAGEELIHELNGVLVAFGLSSGLTGGPLMKGTGDVTVIVGTGHLVLPGLRMGGPDTAALGSALDCQDASVREALRCLSLATASEREAWMQLYKVYEIMDRELKPRGGVTGAGLMTKERATLFGRTANTRNASTGDRGRHSHHHEPPRGPMRLHDARREIRHAVAGWLKMLANE